VCDDVFLGSRALDLGELSRGRLRGPAFRRVLPDVYAPAGLPLDLPLRSRAAHLLVAGRGGVLAGRSAAWALGADAAPPGAPAEVLVPHRYRSHPGLIVHEGRTDEVVRVGGLRVTSALRTAWDLARRLPRVEAVVALDALARVGGFDPADLLARREARPGARGCRSLDDVVRFADPRAESPPETRLRLLLVDAGLPWPAVQYPVVDAHGVVLARCDLAYPEARVAIEYDGELHFTRRGRERDLRRDAGLAALGWVTVRFGRDDVDLAQTAWRVREVLATRRRSG
jgi:hypothetical protein